MTLIPTQVTFRGLAHSDALEADTRERVAWLEPFYAGIVGCRVLVEMPHRHRHDGRHFHVRIKATVPGGAPIVVSRELSRHGGPGAYVRLFPRLVPRTARASSPRGQREPGRKQRGTRPFAEHAA